MSELISGKEALIALANGEDVEYSYKTNPENTSFSALTVNSSVRIDEIFSNHHLIFRIKPKTITLNGIEIPAPFEPKIGEKYWIFETSDKNSYSYISIFENDEQDKCLIKLGAWRTEEEIKQVVAALRSVFGKK